MQDRREGERADKSGIPAGIRVQYWPDGGQPKPLPSGAHEIPRPAVDQLRYNQI